MATHLETPAVRRFERLAYLGDHTVAKGMVDPRGWRVVDGNGQTVGDVKDLIVDTDRMVAAFIDVELDTKFFSLRGDPRVLIPMHHAHRDGNAKRLVVSELTRSRVGALLLARDEHQLGFWNSWWNGDEMDEAVTPVPHTYAPAPPYDSEPPYDSDPLPPADDLRTR